MVEYVGKSSATVVANLIQPDGNTASASASATAMIKSKTANAARDKASNLSQTLAKQTVNKILGPVGITGLSKTATKVNGPTGSTSTSYEYTVQVDTTQT